MTRALDERWIDAGPRDGKTGGAFCMPFIGSRSLVLLNWAGSADSTQTLAHELGHAYHNTTLAERTYLQRRLPMALAETASIFCETLVVESALHRLDGAQRLAVLDVDLAGSNQVVVDIHSRFLFESEVFARRANRTLGVTELNELMLECQATAYADGLDQSTAHPYMWVLKPHYYGVALLQLAVHLRAAVRPRTVRPLPRGSGTLPLRLRNAAVAGRDGHRRGARRGVRTRRHGRGVLDRQPRRDPRPHRRLRAARRRARVTQPMTVSDVSLSPAGQRRGRRRGVHRLATAPLANRSPTCSTTQPRYRVDQVWDGLYRGLRAPSEMTNLPAATARRDRPRGCRPSSPPSPRRVSDCRRHRQVPVGDRRWLPGRDRPDALSRAGHGLHLQPGRLRDGLRVLRHRPGWLRPSAHDRGDRRAGHRRLAPRPGGWTPAQQRRLHGHGRAAGERERPCGRRRNGSTTIIGLSARHITLSTVGSSRASVPSPTRRLPVTLAVSIHAANDALRDELVPLNRRYPLDAVVDACQHYIDVTGRRVSFEWAMIDGVNDRPQDAVELADLARRLRPAAHVNLIPLNPTPGLADDRLTRTRVRQFRDQLDALGVGATVRRNRGTDIDAACGQLAARFNRARRARWGPAVPKARPRSSCAGRVLARSAGAELAEQPRLRGEISSRRADVGKRVDGGAAAGVDLEVQVRGAAGVAGVADVADHLTLGHRSAGAGERAEVGEEVAVAVAAGEPHRVAAEVGLLELSPSPTPRQRSASRSRRACRRLDDCGRPSARPPTCRSRPSRGRGRRSQLRGGSVCGGAVSGGAVCGGAVDEGLSSSGPCRAGSSLVACRPRRPTARERSAVAADPVAVAAGQACPGPRLGASGCWPEPEPAACA